MLAGAGVLFLAASIGAYDLWQAQDAHPFADLSFSCYTDSLTSAHSPSWFPNQSYNRAHPSRSKNAEHCAVCSENAHLIEHLSNNH